MKDASVNAHAAGANLRDDFVHAEAGAGRKGQCLRDYTGAAAARLGTLDIAVPNRGSLTRVKLVLRDRTRGRAQTPFCVYRSRDRQLLVGRCSTLAERLCRIDSRGAMGRNAASDEGHGDNSGRGSRDRDQIARLARSTYEGPPAHRH